MNQPHPEDVRYGQTGGIMKAFNQALHGLDVYTDLSLALDFYKYSLNQDPDEHYHIGFVWIILATFGPYILQYSTFMKL